MSDPFGWLVKLRIGEDLGLSQVPFDRISSSPFPFPMGESSGSLLVHQTGCRVANQATAYPPYRGAVSADRPASSRP